MSVESGKKHGLRLYETKFSFGATSAIITNLALIVGVDTWTNAKLSIIGGILVLALADNFSDSMGIHVYQESECLQSREVWFSTLTNFLTRLFVSLSFIIPIVSFPLKAAVLCSVVWGLFLLAVLSYLIARDRKVNPLIAVVEHIGIATVVILVSHFVGSWIGSKF